MKTPLRSISSHWALLSVLTQHCEWGACVRGAGGQQEERKNQTKREFCSATSLASSPLSLSCFCWLSASGTHVQDCKWTGLWSMTQFNRILRAANVCTHGSLRDKPVPLSVLFPFHKRSNRFAIWMLSHSDCSSPSLLPLQEITPRSATTANSSTNS